MFKTFQYGAVILGLLLPLATQAMSCKNISEDDPSMAACSAEFINPPTFGNLCQNSTLTGTYTLRNNSPVILRINYITIQSFDGLPAAASAIVPSISNNCGSTLANWTIRGTVSPRAGRPPAPTAAGPLRSSSCPRTGTKQLPSVAVLGIRLMATGSHRRDYPDRNPPDRAAELRT